MAGISAKNNAVAELPQSNQPPCPTDIRRAADPRECQAAGGQPLLGSFLFLHILHQLLNLYFTHPRERISKLNTLKSRFFY